MAVAVTAALAACGGPSASEFVQKAAMSDMYEVEAGKIATEKGQSDRVKQFGQHMVDAHTKTTEEVLSMKSNNIKFDLPTKLDSKHQNMIDDLNEAKPEDFASGFDPPARGPEPIARANHHHSIPDSRRLGYKLWAGPVQKCSGVGFSPAPAL